MDYPARLLPKHSYKHIDFQGDLSSIWLCVFTDNTEYFDSNGQLLAEHLQRSTDAFRDYSTNLLGVFEPEDSKWAWVPGETSSYFTRIEWRRGDTVITPIVGKHVNWDDKRGWFFLPANQFHGEVVFGNPINGVVPEFVCKVVHTPMNGNFWHFSIRFDYQGKDSYLDKMSEGTRKSLRIGARQFFRQRVSFTVPEYRTVSKGVYDDLPVEDAEEIGETPKVIAEPKTNDSSTPAKAKLSFISRIGWKVVRGFCRLIGLSKPKRN